MLLLLLLLRPLRRLSLTNASQKSELIFGFHHALRSKKGASCMPANGYPLAPRKGADQRTQHENVPVGLTDVLTPRWQSMHGAVHFRYFMHVDAVVLKPEPEKVAYARLIGAAVVPAHGFASRNAFKLFIVVLFGVRPWYDLSI